MLLFEQFLGVFLWLCEASRAEFPALMGHVELALKEHKRNFQQWSSTIRTCISFFEAMSVIFDAPINSFSGLLVPL